MGKNSNGNDVVLLMDTFSTESKNLLYSLRKTGCDCKAVVIEDDGFLPENVMSVYGYFLGNFKGEKGIKGSPRYFNQITVPDYWEISGTNTRGSVHDLYKERARIFYAQPVHKRLVKVVDWLDERGVVRSSDHYNCYGALYARTVFNAKGQKVNRSYFDAAGREIIVENYVTKDIILNDDQVRIFQSKVDFILYFFKKAGLEQCRLFFNSLSTPFFVSQRLTAPEKCDVLFWQEPVKDEIPGNMQIILNGQASRTETIMVQKRQAYDRLLELGANRQMLHRLGYLYPFEKTNRQRPEALICTNSDRIEHCRKIVKALPQIHFHIAAITEMSSRLMSVGTYSNVSLYPGVKMKVLDELFDRCDYYLDINHESEIVSAVYQAFLHDQLIFAFRETLHNQEFVAEEQIYPAEAVDQLIADMKAVTEDAEKWKKRLEFQHAYALTAESEEYAVLGFQ